MTWRPRRRQVEHQLSDIQTRIEALGLSVSSVQRRLETLDNLIRDLHTDSWNANALRTERLQDEIRNSANLTRELSDGLIRRVMQNHADTWEADEKRALSLADVVLISIAPQIDAIKRDLIALVGEKAVEVFHEVSRNG